MDNRDETALYNEMYRIADFFDFIGQKEAAERMYKVSTALQDAAIFNWKDLREKLGLDK